jgi:hypothetical protein
LSCPLRKKEEANLSLRWKRFTKNIERKLGKNPPNPNMFISVFLLIKLEVLERRSF